MKGETVFMLLLLGGAAYLLYASLSGSAVTGKDDYSSGAIPSNPYLAPTLPVDYSGAVDQTTVSPAFMASLS
jgi:hypothetical protein